MKELRVSSYAPTTPTIEDLPRIVPDCAHLSTEAIGVNRYHCPDCGLKYRKVRANVLRRRRLLKW